MQVLNFSIMWPGGNLSGIKEIGKLVPAPVILKSLDTSCQKAISEGFFDRGIRKVLLHQLPHYRSQFICLEVDVII